MIGKFFVSVIFSILISLKLFAQIFITEKNEIGDFPLVTLSQTAVIYVDNNDDWLVHKTASLLQNDIKMVTDKKPEIVSVFPSSVKNIIISINKDDHDVKAWSDWVANNILIKTTNHSIKTGKHNIKFRMVSPAIILQKLVLDFGGLKPGYLSPQETICNLKTTNE